VLACSMHLGMTRVLASTLIFAACGGQSVSRPAESNSGSAGSSGGLNSACDASDETIVLCTRLATAGAVLAIASDKGTSIEAFPAGLGRSYAATGRGTTCFCTRGGISSSNGSVNAGTVTVQGPDRRVTLATAVYQVTSPVPAYLTTPALPWNPGDALFVSATGAPNGLASFAGTLQTGGPLIGVAPVLAQSAPPIPVSLAKDFVVTWVPEGKSDESVSLVINQAWPGALGGCTCSAPDADGKLTVPAASLSQAFVPTSSAQTQGGASLVRSIVRTVAAGNASVDLVGQAVVNGGVSFQ
jgi:hypothetical protein